MKQEKQVHISTIKVGDTVRHNGELLTVCNRVLKYSSFMGTTIYGDSYKLGYKLVTKVIF